MHKILIFLFVITSAFSVNAQEKDSIVILNVTDYKTQTENKDVQLIDVRTPEEFKDGHIQDAINIDYYSEDFLKEFETLDKNKPLYLYCRSGNRSYKAAVKLKKMGFKDIYDLEGGILNYNKKQE
ncbi:rhodanese-like domain-containing protein [Xanthomarina sp. F2636L]|uniref:rhodanese-like domain-containing protein n=1 Tax=Xanthomarina sp. F2636L TaxID=2996018 RepID=UPI00225E1FBB|nr:rhodanese-like domain-containing protein [Xanthomarina sp. F2636L]MCX7550342.1 rhodanese-like domain-containing protein [Xanthomarina sp. F2636L]